MRSGKPSWQRKLDKLKGRAKRVRVNMDDLPAGDEALMEKTRATCQMDVGEALQSASVQEAMRRITAVEDEHQLDTRVLGCYVTLTILSSKGKSRYGLAISYLDKRPPQAKSWTEPPNKFERIRKYLGAPESMVAKGTVALHWVWDVE